MAIESFSNEYRFLSNFYPRSIIVGGWDWLSSEHAYQAAKSLLRHEWSMIQNCPSPGSAKRMGRRMTLRPDWDTFRLLAMGEILEAKFTQHPDLKLKLIMTNPIELIEGNQWGDTYWGVCKGIGENNLGKLLMKLRSELL